MKGWERAKDLADRTPESRNRYVDLLRAVSIAAVVVGHWLIAAPWMDHGRIRLDHMLGLAPWTQWLTWVFQVMPVFFIVGGYSNAVSWESARSSGRDYGTWVGSRLRRLIAPVVPLLLLWAVAGMVAHGFDIPAPVVRIASQAALVPVWFLAVYVLVVLVAPLTHAAWRRFGMASFWVLVACAIGIDAGRFAAGLVGPAWANYLVVWMAVHHIGYMWRDGRLGGVRKSLPFMLGGIVALLALVRLAGYPLSMVGVPGDEVSNTLPPSLAMLALGAAQGGLLLAFEAPARRWLRRTRPWAATILVNGMIMSIYLWHLTAMVLLIGVLRLLGGLGLGLAPGSSAWWASRPLWMVVLAVILLGFLAVFGRFERLREREVPERMAAWRAITGATLVCLALALAALDGIGGGSFLGVRLWVVMVALAGAALVGAAPRIQRRAA